MKGILTAFGRVSERPPAMGFGEERRFWVEISFAIVVNAGLVGRRDAVTPSLFSNEIGVGCM